MPEVTITQTLRERDLYVFFTVSRCKVSNVQLRSISVVAISSAKILHNSMLRSFP